MTDAAKISEGLTEAQRGNSVERTFAPAFSFALTLHAASGVNSSLESTRIYWREKLGMSAAEARDPRPLTEVLAGRAVAAELGE